MSKLQYEVFLRSREFERAAAGMQMRPMDWRLLLALDGRTALGDLAQRLLLDVDEAVDTVVVAERLRMVERRRVSLSEYRSEFERRAAENAGFAPQAPAIAPEAEPPAGPLEAPAELPGAPAANRLPADLEAAPLEPAFASEALAPQPELAEEPARFAEYAPFSEPPAFGEEPAFAEPASPAGFDPFAGSAGVMLGEASEARLETFHVMREGVAHHVAEYADVRDQLQDEPPALAQDAPHQPEFAGDAELVARPELVEGRAEESEPATETAPVETTVIPNSSKDEPALGHRIAAWAEAPLAHEAAPWAQAPAEPAVEPQPPAETWAQTPAEPNAEVWTPVAAEAEAPSMPDAPAAEPALTAPAAPWEAAAPAAENVVPPVVKPIEFKLRPSVQVVIR